MRATYVVQRKNYAGNWVNVSKNKYPVEGLISLYADQFEYLHEDYALRAAKYYKENAACYRNTRFFEVRVIKRQDQVHKVI